MAKAKRSPAHVWATTDSFIFGINGLCTYCGDEATDLDHVVPWSFISAQDRRKGGDSPGVRTHACRECNSILGAKFFPTFLERAQYVREKLARRNARWLGMPKWDEEELDELRPTFRRVIGAAEEMSRAAKRRVSWMYSDTFWQILEEVRERVSDRYCPSYRKHVDQFFARRGEVSDAAE